MNRVDKILRSPAGFASSAAFFLLFLAFDLSYASLEPRLGSARVVFQTNYGDIEFGFFHEIAPKTVDHIFKLVRLGCYNTNHFFRVDKGFVAQVADVSQGRSAPMNEEQRFEAQKTVVGEFSKVKHVRGTLSMGRYSDPDSGSSSFSILLGDAPHLDGQYAIFGWVTKGEDTLKKLEEVPTRREGIFVMALFGTTLADGKSIFQPLSSANTPRFSLHISLPAFRSPRFSPAPSFPIEGILFRPTIAKAISKMTSKRAAAPPPAPNSPAPAPLSRADSATLSPFRAPPTLRPLSGADPPLKDSDSSNLLISVESNPLASRLAELGIKSWPKWGCPPGKFPLKFDDRHVTF